MDKLTTAKFEDYLRSWYFEYNTDVHTLHLPEVLNAHIGGVLEYNEPSNEMIYVVLHGVIFTFEGLKEMSRYYEDSVSADNKPYDLLLGSLAELFKSDIEKVVMRSLYEWIWQDEDQPKPNRSYALSINDKFKSLISVLTEISSLVAAMEKGGGNNA